MNSVRWNLKRPLVHDTLVTTILAVTGKAAGITVPFFIAAWFGAGTEIDAFFLAYSIIIFFASIFGSTVSTVIVPYIVELYKEKGDIGKFISPLLILGGILYGCLLFAGVLICRLLPGVVINQTGLDRITLIILEMIPFVIFLVWTNTIDGVLNALKKFKLPAISPALRAVITILIIFILHNSIGIHSIITGYITGEFFRFLLLVVIIKRTHLFQFYFSLSISQKLKDFFKKGVYQTIAMILVGVNPLIDKIMASYRGPGGISILYYADRMYIIPVSFLVSGFLVTLLSYMSGNLYLENKEKFKSLVHKAGKIAGISSFIIMIPVFFFYKPVTGFLFSHGKLDPMDIIRIQNVFFGYFIGFFPFIISQIYGYALVVLKKTKTLMFWALFLLVLNIVLNYILMQIFDLLGLSLSTSIIRFINCIFYIIIFYRHLAGMK
ncbi:MAG: polysaccharide biosynthesis C-terminal domain-containing protein [Spirochaetales bacterium]|nr:polysaccharide biosynthesis C-terminal domain-containing protein [Spirochaetales bacterium]